MASSGVYAPMDLVAYNPSPVDLDMGLNSVLNASVMQSVEVDTGIVNVGTQLNIKDGPLAVTMTALGLAGNQSYNFPQSTGTDGQVLALSGMSGQLMWATTSGGPGVTDINACTGSVALSSSTLSVVTNTGAGTITIDTSGTSVTSLAGLTGDVVFDSGNSTISFGGTGQTIDLSVTVPVPAGTNAGDFPSWDVGTSAYVVTAAGAGAVADVNGCTGSVVLQSMTLNITPDTGTGYIALDVTNALPAGTNAGDYPVWDTGTSTYVATGAPVTSLNGITGAASLTNTDGTITGDVSGQIIDFRVTVPVPAGATDGDYPAWDTGTSAYVATAAPTGGVPNVNGITAAVSIESISLNLVTDLVAGTVSIDLPPVVMDFLGQTGSITAQSSNNSISVQAGTGGLTDFTFIMPAGLASPGALDVGSAFFSISNININLTGSSVIQATIQNPDDTANPGVCWLMYAYPIASVAGNGGGITFRLSDPITAGSTLVVAWAVIKY